MLVGGKNEILHSRKPPRNSSDHYFTVRVRSRNFEVKTSACWTRSFGGFCLNQLPDIICNFDECRSYAMRRMARTICSNEQFPRPKQRRLKLPALFVPILSDGVVSSWHGQSAFHLVVPLGFAPKIRTTSATDKYV